MDTNALYYTLSTIAQTLAGAMAILVAVVLFKLSSLAKSIETAKERLDNAGVAPFKYWPVLRDHGVETLLKQVQDEMGYTLGRKVPFRLGCEAGTAAYRDWGKIKNRLYTALGFTVVDIAFCFAALPFTPRLISSPFATQTTLVLAVGLGIACLILYVWLIAAMVERPAD